MTSDWKFDQQIVPVFDEHVRKNVPMYEEIHRLITQMAGWFLEEDTKVYDIGTSTGEVLWNLTHYYQDKKCHYIGFDTSVEMCQKANERLASAPYPQSAVVLNQDIREKEVVLSNASFVTCVLTLQFIPIRDRIAVLRKIHEGLHKGGAFVLVEKISGENARFNEMWIELYHELKLRNGLSEQEVFQKSHAIRGVLRPLTLEENLTLVREAGFQDVDVFFKWTNFVGVIAIK